MPRVHRILSFPRILGYARISAFALLVALGFETWSLQHKINRDAFVMQGEMRKTLALKAQQVGYPVYPYSIVSGGVHSASDLAAAVNEDPLVRAHYADFDQANVRFLRAGEDRFEYVSYRRGNKIFWTQQKLRIPQGELLLTDGHTWARSRCGNRLSATPVPSVGDDAPPSEFVLNNIVAVRPVPPVVAADAPYNVPYNDETRLSLPDDRLALLEPKLPLNLMPSPTLTNTDHLPTLGPDTEQWVVPTPGTAAGFGFPFMPILAPGLEKPGRPVTPSAIPEPPALALMALAGAVFGLGRWRRTFCAWLGAGYGACRLVTRLGLSCVQPRFTIPIALTSRFSLRPHKAAGPWE